MEQDKGLEVTADEFREWVEHRITKHVVKQILGTRSAIKDYIAEGNTVAKEAPHTTDFMVGQIRGLTEVFNLFSDAKDDAKEETPAYGH